MNIIGFSKALFSTWIYYSPERILFDAGEGVSTALGSKVYAFKYVFLTHGHVDHIAGLWGIVNIRNNGMGDREKPLDVFYPKGNRAVEEYTNFIKKANPELRFSFNVHPLEEGEKVFLRDAGGFKRYVQPFRTKHVASEVSFGYHIFEVRRKLKEEFQNLDSKVIAKLVKEKGRDFVTDEYHKKILTISGDSLALDPEEVEGTELLIHECTFLDPRDRRYKNHASIDEVMETVKKAGVKRVILYHISTRYIRSIKSVIKKYREMLPDVEITYMDPRRVFEM
ncbi:ribonuclease Z [Thermotoga sp. SG1]|uniref:ribonuclease Z n=1 Tax=Thermotoga sp. SG1 TaxID=126739 RepID=UPI000C78A8AC|nr:ribonuclease Z [Thermotoga sp. SG1]PLV56966.1 MBL fold metallo-hydrolase [Thermotoga sp. SG1]